MILEKGFQYYKDNQLLEKDTADLRTAIRTYAQIQRTDSLLIDELRTRYEREVIFKETAFEEVDYWKGEYKKEKGKGRLYKWLIPVAGAVGLYGGFQLGLSTSKL